ncbi:MAG TPA: S1 RNA-binding domain-containing protein [Chloroflexota bacterium]|nr:S1 RNA-binding domain-containing protein [Chloroflexota bacterium]HUM70046.1 S1 RNA-binding domain-containing protein [Chloroflexota bacterium]
MMEDTNFEEFLETHDYELPQVGDIRKGIIVAVTQQGVIVDLGLKRDGIVPGTDLAKLEPEERAELHVNDEISVYVMNTEAPDSLQVSIHLAKMNQDWVEAEQLMETGDIFEGEVIGYNKGGAIVPYGRLRGFIPASHLAALTRGLNDRQRQQKLAKLRGQKIPLKVIEVDRRRRRLVFSQRDAQKEWDELQKGELMEKLQEGDVLHGRVSGLRDFGIFVDLGGVDGLVHISELAWHRIDHPREVVKVGDEVDVYVMKIDRDDQRISLSRKKLLPNPWDTVEQRYHINQLVEGCVTRIVDYGAFAEIEPGVEGLLHLSQLSRGQVENAGEVVKEGETHLLRVVSIEKDRQRIGLSLRQVSANEQIEWMSRKQAEAGTSVAAAEVEQADEYVDEDVEVEATEPVVAEIETDAEMTTDSVESEEVTAVEVDVEVAADDNPPAEAESVIEETEPQEAEEN